MFKGLMCYVLSDIDLFHVQLLYEIIIGIWKCKCVYVCMYVCKFLCMYVCIYVCVYVYRYACMYVCLYVCMYLTASFNSAAQTYKTDQHK